MIKKIGIRIFKGVLIFVGVILLYLLTTFILSKITVNKEASASSNITIYILTNGVHTDIVVPTITDQENWSSKIDFLPSNLNVDDYKYLALGWGDKGFYLETPTWAELKVSTALKAIVGLSGTAIHAKYHKTMVESGSCKKIEISEAQYAQLLKYIQSSFETTTDGSFMKIETKANKGETDAFYEAKGRYNPLNTCNSWANRGLKAANQKACLWTAFQSPIFQKYE